MDRCVVKHNNCPKNQVVVYWSNSFPKDTTWEDWEPLNYLCPHFKP